MKSTVFAVVAFGALVSSISVSEAQVAGTHGYESFDEGNRGFITVDIPGAAVPDTSAAAVPPSRVLFINDCKPAGCPITPGNFNRADDSRTNVSSIVQGSGTRTLQPYSGSPTTWAAIVACVRENYAPFNIQVVTTEPSSSSSYFEAMAAGSPSNVGFSSQTAGVASFSCGIIPNAISFSFLNLNPSDVNDACWTISQESAHNFGLSHEMLGGDAMTYMQNPPRKRFLDQTACIGTQGCCAPSQECQCGATQQNSFQELLSIFGPAGATPPMISISDPLNNAAVDPGFPVHATVTDDNGIGSVELLIDGAVVSSLVSPPYAFNAPTAITPGAHTVEIHAIDTLGTDSRSSIHVNVGDPCTQNSQCASVGADYQCVDGRCVPGMSVPGGLGATCNGPEECLSGQCATKGGENRCSELCTPGTAGSCGDGFDCLDNGAGAGLCWPGADSGSCGCDSDGGSAPTLPIGAGLLLSALLLRRRRATTAVG
jgi:MYXO-CTERM domain-containing protein